MSKNKNFDELFVRSIQDDNYIYDDVLSDTKINGKEQPWRKHKMESNCLSDSYNRLGMYSKSELVYNCGSYLFFDVCASGKKKLVKASFCRVRLCPMCAWRRSLKLYGQVSKIMNYLTINRDYKYIFVTLTCKNVTKDKLSAQVDLMLKAFKELHNKDERFKGASKGWFRSLEVTHDLDKYITRDMWYGNKAKHIYARGDYYAGLNLRIGDANPQYNTYHPHIHMVLAVEESYFTDSRLYMSYSKWCAKWQHCLGVDYVPVVWVNVIKIGDKVKKVERAVAEITKYAVKAADYIVRDKAGYVDEELTDEFVSTLDAAFRGRRLIAFGGDFKKVHKLLNLDDTEDGDLVDTNNVDELRDDINYAIVCYGWSKSILNYFRICD